MSAFTPVTSPRTALIDAPDSDDPPPRRGVEGWITWDGLYAPKRVLTESATSHVGRRAYPGWELDLVAEQLAGDERGGTMVGVTSSDDSPWPRTAEELMRSRFEAFRTGDAAWLLASWHPSTRPAEIDLSGNPTWRGLQIVETVEGGTADDTGIVEFRATYLRPGGGVDSQHERSRFVREDGRWYYVDAV